MAFLDGSLFGRIEDVGFLHLPLCEHFTGLSDGVRCRFR